MSDGTKLVRVKKDETTGELYLDISDFSDYLQTEQVDSYEVNINADKTVTIKFYDKCGKNLLLKK